MPSAGPLREAAKADLDSRLRARFQTLLHGDAKPASFLWADGDGLQPSIFSMPAPGCGIRDVAYFSTAVGARTDARANSTSTLRRCRKTGAKAPRKLDAAALEQEWRELFPVAWSDFCRLNKAGGALSARALSPCGGFSLALGKAPSWRARLSRSSTFLGGVVAQSPALIS